MNAQRLADLVHILEGSHPNKSIFDEERQEIAGYIRHSVPRETYDRLASSVLELVTICELNEQHSTLTHNVRNGLAAVSGYQVLELV